MKEKVLFDSIVEDDLSSFVALLDKRNWWGKGYAYDVKAEQEGVSVWEAAMGRSVAHANAVWKALSRRYSRDENMGYVLDACYAAIEHNNVWAMHYLASSGFLKQVDTYYGRENWEDTPLYAIDTMLEIPAFQTIYPDLYKTDIDGIHGMIADRVFETKSPELIKSFCKYGSIEDVTPKLVEKDPQTAALFVDKKENSEPKVTWAEIVQEKMVSGEIPVRKVAAAKLPNAAVARVQEEKIPVRSN